MSKPLDPALGSAPASRMLELLWLDPEHLARVRKQPAWRALLDEARRAPADPPGEPLLFNQETEAEDRRDLLLLLARADATDGDGVAAALADGVREHGKFAPPLVLVAGELRLPYDEVPALKAAVTTATPFVGGDEPLKAAVDAAREFLAIPDLAPAPAVVEAMTARIREAFGRVKRAVPAGYLEAQADRSLLEQRRYQRRVFQGAPCLRALLQASGDRGTMLSYLPAAAADALPLFHRFGVRLVAEAHLSVDQYESHPWALRALAVARELPAPGARRG